ncbi:MAG: CBS domain-containing protein [Methylovirgula sp.]
MMRACDVMTTKVAGIHPKATLSQAIDLMATLGISCLPVIDISGTLVGMLTAGDIMRRTSARAQRALLHDAGVLNDDTDPDMDARVQIVEEVMTPELCAVQETVSAAEAARLAKARRIKRLPVLHGDKLIGLIDCADLARIVGADLDAEPNIATSQDSAIKAAIHATLHRLKWTPGPLIDVAVEAGQVELHGVLLREHERKTLRSAVETIPGVSRCTDHLVVAESMNDMFPQLPDDMVRRQKLFC